MLSSNPDSTEPEADTPEAGTPEALRYHLQKMYLKAVKSLNEATHKNISNEKKSFHGIYELNEWDLLNYEFKRIMNDHVVITKPTEALKISIQCFNPLLNKENEEVYVPEKMEMAINRVAAAWMIDEKTLKIEGDAHKMELQKLMKEA